MGLSRRRFQRASSFFIKHNKALGWESLLCAPSWLRGGCLNRCVLMGWSAGGSCDMQLVLAAGLWSAPCTQSTALVAVGPRQPPVSVQGVGKPSACCQASPCQSCTTWPRLTMSRILGPAHCCCFSAPQCRPQKEAWGVQGAAAPSPPCRGADGD